MTDGLHSKERNFLNNLRFESFLMCQLENCAAFSFVRFRPHIEAGLEMASDLEATHLSLERISAEKLKIVLDKKSESNLRLEKLKSEMSVLTIELKSEIRVLQDDLEKVVTNGIRDEIETIQQVVFDFDDAQFIHDQTVIQVYIQQLFRFFTFYFSKDRNIRRCTQIDKTGEGVWNAFFPKFWVGGPLCCKEIQGGTSFLCFIIFL